MNRATTIANSARLGTREALLDAGMTIMLEKGYTNAGIAEILQVVGVPKGSFYHYFESKEDFALAIIARTADAYSQRMSGTLGNSSLKPINRLKKYFQEAQADMVKKECRKGCLIGNLSQEMADQSETLRDALTAVLRNGRAALTACIAEAQKEGEIRNDRSAAELARVIQFSWTGAMLLSKTEKNPESLDAFNRLVFEDVLKSQ